MIKTTLKLVVRKGKQRFFYLRKSSLSQTSFALSDSMAKNSGLTRKLRKG